MQARESEIYPVPGFPVQKFYGLIIIFSSCLAAARHWLWVQALHRNSLQKSSCTYDTSAENSSNNNMPLYMPRARHFRAGQKQSIRVMVFTCSCADKVKEQMLTSVQTTHYQSMGTIPQCYCIMLWSSCLVVLFLLNVGKLRPNQSGIPAHSLPSYQPV